MARTPRLTRLSREDFKDAPEWFGRFIDLASPFFGDVSTALGGQIDGSNMRRQLEPMTLTTAATLEATFSSGKVGFKNRIGTQPQKVSLAKCNPAVMPSFAQETWTPLTLVNSWVTIDSDNAVPSYKLLPNGRVVFRGTVKSGAVPSTIATLPAGFRPEYATPIGIDSAGAFGKVTVDYLGVLAVAVGSTTAVALDQVTYDATPGTWTGIGPFGPPVWDITSGGMIRIRYIAGLSPSTKYELTFEVE